MKVVYVIGPFRAENSWEVEQNIRVAEGMALEVLKLGAAVICPHTMCRFYQGAAPDELWLKADLRLLIGCDAAITVGAWMRSSGSREEVKACTGLPIPVFHNLHDLKVWLRGDDA